MKEIKSHVLSRVFNIIAKQNQNCKEIFPNWILNFNINGIENIILDQKSNSYKKFPTNKQWTYLFS